MYTQARLVYAYFPSVDDTRESLEREWYCTTPDCTFYDVNPADLTDECPDLPGPGFGPADFVAKEDDPYDG